MSGFTILSVRFRVTCPAAWGRTLPLPIIPTGAIPLHDDLARTPTSHVVKPSEAYKYQVKGGDKQGQ
jgi:hypothetical protein